MDEKVTPPNPLASLCTQMGLSPQAIAGLCDLPLHKVLTAMAPDPSPLTPFWKICQTLGIKLQVQGVKEFSFWVDQRAFDDLFFDSNCRKAMQLLPAQKKRGDLWQMIKDLKVACHGYEEMSRMLERSIVPTSTGQREWTRSLVFQMMENQGTEHGEDLIIPSDECVEDFRSLAISNLLTELCPDSFAAARYEFEIYHNIQNVDQLDFVAQAPMPRLIADRMLAHLASVPWLAGRWGQESPLPQPTP